MKRTHISRLSLLVLAIGVLVIGMPVWDSVRGSSQGAPSPKKRAGETIPQRSNLEISDPKLSTTSRPTLQPEAKNLEALKLRDGAAYYHERQRLERTDLTVPTDSSAATVEERRAEARARIKAKLMAALESNPSSN